MSNSDEKKLGKTLSRGVMPKQKPSFPDNWPSGAVRQKTASLATSVTQKSDSVKVAIEQKGGDATGSEKNLIDAYLENEQIVSEYNRRTESLRMFVQALGEVAPLVGFVSRDAGDINGADFKKKISELFQAQIGIVGLIISNIGISSDENNSRVVRPVLAKKISELIGSGILSSDDDRESIPLIMDLLDIFMRDRPYIGEVIDSSFMSSDVLVNVKLALFPASLRFSKMLNAIGLLESEVLDWLKWHHNSTVCLAKDLAFNWDKSASFKDREKLFESSLSHCAVLVESAWREEFELIIKSGLTHVSYDVFDEASVDFNGVVADRGMGHIDDDNMESSLEDLKRSIYKHCNDLSSKYSSLSLFEIDPEMAKRHTLFEIVKRLPKFWIDSCDYITEKISALSDEEYQQWEKTEGQKPMSLVYFFGLIDSFSAGVFSSINAVNKDDLLVKCKSKMAVLWGLSDAVCKIKRR